MFFIKRTLIVFLSFFISFNLYSGIGEPREYCALKEFYERDARESFNTYIFNLDQRVDYVSFARYLLSEMTAEKEKDLLFLLDFWASKSPHEVLLFLSKLKLNDPIIREAYYLAFCKGFARKDIFASWDWAVLQEWSIETDFLLCVIQEQGHMFASKILDRLLELHTEEYSDRKFNRVLALFDSLIQSEDYVSSRLLLDKMADGQLRDEVIVYLMSELVIYDFYKTQDWVLEQSVEDSRAFIVHLAFFMWTLDHDRGRAHRFLQRIDDGLLLNSLFDEIRIKRPDLFTQDGLSIELKGDKISEGEGINESIVLSEFPLFSRIHNESIRALMLEAYLSSLSSLELDKFYLELINRPIYPRKEKDLQVYYFYAGSINPFNVFDCIEKNHCKTEYLRFFKAAFSGAIKYRSVPILSNLLEILGKYAIDPDEILSDLFYEFGVYDFDASYVALSILPVSRDLKWNCYMSLFESLYQKGKYKKLFVVIHKVKDETLTQDFTASFVGRIALYDYPVALKWFQSLEGTEFYRSAAYDLLEASVRVRKVEALDWILAIEAKAFRGILIESYFESMGDFTLEERSFFKDRLIDESSLKKVKE